MTAKHLAIVLGVLVSAGVVSHPPASRADPVAPSANATSPANATPPLTVPRPDMPDVAARRGANRARMLDARIERLHAALQLAPAQDKLWPSVAEAMHGLAEARGRGFRQQLDAVADPVDGLKMQGDHMANVGAAMSRLADATKPLVTTFTADQKSRLPTLMERAPLRKVASRAFGVPPTPAATPHAPSANTSSPSAGGGAAQTKQDQDDDE